MKNRVLKVKQLIELSTGETDIKDELRFKLEFKDISVEDKVYLDIPDYYEVDLFGMYFEKDTIDKIRIHKCISDDKTESFIIYVYMGKLTIARYYSKNELYISVGRYGRIGIEGLEEWHINCYKPESLQIIES